MKLPKKYKSLLLIVILGLSACKEYNPKPKAYPRIYYPEKSYVLSETECPFRFEMPVYSQLAHAPDAEYNCWYNLRFLPFNATLHLSYRPFSSLKSLDSLMEDAYHLAFKHISKAEEIIERDIYDSSRSLYGMVYDLQGKTATPINFYLTDKKQHFFRGSFYFNIKTEGDSVGPIYDFIRQDIDHLIGSFEFE